PPPAPPLFPYTTLFRSLEGRTAIRPVGAVPVLGAGDLRGLHRLSGIRLASLLHPVRSVEHCAGSGRPVMGGGLVVGPGSSWPARDRKSTRLNSSHRTIS